MSATYAPPPDDTDVEPITEGSVPAMVSARPRPVSNDPLPTFAVADLAEQLIAELELQHEFGDDAIVGEQVGFRELDEHLRVQGGRLYVFGAREGVGKTVLGLQMARHIATRVDGASGAPGKVLYYITEMSAQEVLKRVVCSFAHIDSKDLERAVTLETIERVREALRILWRSGLIIVEAISRSVTDIVEHVRATKTACPDLRAVFVDNLTGVSAAKGSRREKRSDEYITDTIQALLESAVGAQVPVVLFAHLKRPDGGVRRVPVGTDLAGSDGINRFAHAIGLLHVKDGSENYTQLPSSGFGGGFGGGAFSGVEEHRWTGPVGTPAAGATHELRFSKNRSGPLFTCDLRLVGSEGRFEDPNVVTRRPYEVPAAESARVAEYRAKRLDLGI